NGVLHPRQPRALLGVLGIAQPDYIGVGKQQEFPARTQGRDSARQRRPISLSRGGVPQLGLPPTFRQENLASGGKSQTQDLGLVHNGLGGQLARFRIPQTDEAVGCARCDGPAVGTKPGSPNPGIVRENCLKGTDARLPGVQIGAKDRLQTIIFTRCEFQPASEDQEARGGGAARPQGLALLKGQGPGQPSRLLPSPPEAAGKGRSRGGGPSAAGGW